MCVCVCVCLFVAEVCVCVSWEILVMREEGGSIPPSPATPLTLICIIPPSHSLLKLVTFEWLQASSSS